LLLGAQIALGGVALGIPVGLDAGAWLAGVIEQFFPLPVVESSLRLDLYLRAAAIGIVLPVLATAVPVWRAIRVAPVDAIRIGAHAGRSSGLAWLLRGVRVPGGSLANLPLRNVLRAPRRTVMTLLGIGAVVTIVIALAGVMDSFDETLSASRDEALAGSSERLTVDLPAPERDDGSTARRIAAAASVGRTQPSLRLASTLIAGDRRVDVALETARPGPLWHPTLREGSLSADRPGVVIARRAAEDLGVDVGDRLTVQHPVATGPETFGLARTGLPVIAIHASPLRFVAYANQPAVPTLHADGLVSRVSVVPAPGYDADDVKAELLRLPGVAAVQGAAATTEAVDQRLEQFTEILLITVLIAGAMALLIAFNASAINADERAREHATMFAYGVPLGRVLRGGVAEALVIGALGTAVGVVAGHALLTWIVDTTMPETMPDIGALIDVAPSTYAMAIAAGTVVVGVAPLLTARRLHRTDIPSTLRVVE
jgi:putative ABC transport system permease protein